MSIVGKILTASLGLVATSPSGRVKLEEKTYLIRDKVLGEGGCGTVCEAEDLSSKSPVAVKTQNEGPAANIEAQALRLFRDIPHAVGFRADILGSPKSKPEEQKRHIVMDLVKNKDIVATFFNPQTPDIRLTYDERITIARQVLEFLEALHSRGWTFFDLKLPNLIFDQDSLSLKVIDFGGARDTTQKDFPPPITTASHRAPEYILQKPVSPSYDIWSFGCLLFTLLTEKNLFHVPKDIKTEDKSRYVLQKIVAQLGKPSFEYLINSPKTPTIFDTNFEFREKFELPPIKKKWEEVVRENGQKENWPAEEIELWIGMLGSCLRYENRATATELLKSPIFQNEIGVHLHFNSHPLVQCQLYLVRRSIYDEDYASGIQDPSWDIKVCINNTTDNHLHLPKDIRGEYYLALDKDGISSRHMVTLKEGSILDISSFQKELYPKGPTLGRKSLLLKFEEAALEQVPGTTPIKEEKPPEPLPVGFKLSVQWLLNQNAAKPKLAALGEKTEEQAPQQPEIPPLEPRKSKRLMKRQQRATELAAAEAEPIIQSKRLRAPAQPENPQ